MRQRLLCIQFGSWPAPGEMKMETKSLEKRSCRRMKMVMGLRVPGQTQTADRLVHTLDISSTGAKIGASREWIQPGSVLTLHRRHARAQCQVMWPRAVAPGDSHMRTEFTGHQPASWG